MKTKLLNDWEGKTAQEAIGDFYNENEKDNKERFVSEILADMKWLFGSYSYAIYSGDAFVIFKKEDTIFEVNGGHCSCYGLEGQRKPEETTLPAILDRLDHGLGESDYCENEFNTELRIFIKGLQNERN